MPVQYEMTFSAIEQFTLKRYVLCRWRADAGSSRGFLMSELVYTLYRALFSKIYYEFRRLLILNMFTRVRSVNSVNNWTRNRWTTLHLATFISASLVKFAQSPRNVLINTNSTCCSSRIVKFGQNSEILTLHFCATHVSCLKVIDFFLIKMPSIHENCTVALYLMTSYWVKYQRACRFLIPDRFTFYRWRTFQLEKVNDFWADGKFSKVVCIVSFWHKKIASGPWAPLLEQPIKYFLTSLFLSDNEPLIVNCKNKDVDLMNIVIANSPSGK